MKKRGQGSFIHLPGFAAGLYDRLTQTKAIQQQTIEIAQDWSGYIYTGRLLDIGTGPGRLLKEMHHINPGLELFGLDISSSMAELAQKNLAGIHADLLLGNIQKTDFDPDFFDLVTCTGSFYLWDEPETCLAEVHRILKNGCSACFYETRRDFDSQVLKEGIEANLKSENLARKLLTPYYLKRQLHMTYRLDKIPLIIERTVFANHYKIEAKTVAGLAIWLRIMLQKRG